jgi:hypothetical protein
VGVPPAGFGILPKQSFQVRDRETRSPAGETPTLPETKIADGGQEKGRERGRAEAEIFFSLPSGRAC